LRRILESLGLERKPPALFLEANVVGTPFTPLQERLRKEKEATEAPQP
jgi:hypothetical protein